MVTPLGPPPVNLRDILAAASAPPPVPKPSAGAVDSPPPSSVNPAEVRQWFAALAADTPSSGKGQSDPMQRLVAQLAKKHEPGADADAAKLLTPALAADCLARLADTFGKPHATQAEVAEKLGEALKTMRPLTASDLIDDSTRIDIVKLQAELHVLKAGAERDSAVGALGASHPPAQLWEALSAESDAEFSRARADLKLAQMGSPQTQVAAKAFANLERQLNTEQRMQRAQTSALAGRADLGVKELGEAFVEILGASADVAEAALTPKNSDGYSPEQLKRIKEMIEALPADKRADAIRVLVEMAQMGLAAEDRRPSELACGVLGLLAAGQDDKEVDCQVQLMQENLALAEGHLDEAEAAHGRAETAAAQIANPQTRVQTQRLLAFRWLTILSARVDTASAKSPGHAAMEFREYRQKLQSEGLLSPEDIAVALLMEAQNFDRAASKNDSDPWGDKVSGTLAELKELGKTNPKLQFLAFTYEAKYYSDKGDSAKAIERLNAAQLSLAAFRKEAPEHAAKAEHEFMLAKIGQLREMVASGDEANSAKAANELGKLVTQQEALPEAKRALSSDELGVAKLVELRAEFQLRHYDKADAILNSLQKHRAMPVVAQFLDQLAQRGQGSKVSGFKELITTATEDVSLKDIAVRSACGVALAIGVAFVVGNVPGAVAVGIAAASIDITVHNVWLGRHHIDAAYRTGLNQDSNLSTALGVGMLALDAIAAGKGIKGGLELGKAGKAVAERVATGAAKSAVKAGLGRDIRSRVAKLAELASSEEVREKIGEAIKDVLKDEMTHENAREWAALDRKLDSISRDSGLTDAQKKEEMLDAYKETLTAVPKRLAKRVLRLGQ